MQKIIKNGHEFLVHLVKGSDPWFAHFWDYVEDGGWEPYTFTILDKLLTKETIYIDIGAWVGPTVLYASRLCKQCYAIEPDLVSYQQLCSNITANSIQNIITLNEAILDYDGIVTLGSKELGDSMTRIGNANNSFQVPCQTLGSFVGKHNIIGPMFIKMDIEGAEELALKSIEFFERCKPTLYVSLHHAWFKDKVVAMNTVRKISELYKRHYDINLNEVKIDDTCSGFIFTE